MAHNRRIIAISTLIIAILAIGASADISTIFSGHDLNITAGSMVSGKTAAGNLAVVFDGGFSMNIGGRNYKGQKAVAVIKTLSSSYQGIQRSDYDCLVYIEGDVQIQADEKAKTVKVVEKSVYQGRALILRFLTTGQVFATAEKISQGDVLNSSEYQKAAAVFGDISSDIEVMIVQPEAAIPKLEKTVSPKRVKVAEIKAGRIEEVKPEKVELVKTIPADEGPKFRYPVKISSVSAKPVKIDSEKVKTDDGLSVATIRGRFYLWQQLDDGVGMLELLADNAVIFYATDQVKFSAGIGEDGLDASGPVKAVYLQGDVEMSEGSRTIRADEFYYDFDSRRGLALNSEMRSFDTSRGIPIYLRAERIRIVATNRFEAENVMITSSEFHDPQIKLTASTISLRDTTDVDTVDSEITDSSYELEMKDIRMSAGDTTFFYWPGMASNLQRPDVPIKGIHISQDSDFGFSIESRWFLHRLLGIPEPNGVDSTLELDYYGKRGLGAGANIEYETEDSFGSILGYIINDRGEDDLGRTRENLDPDRDLRGRFKFQHRQSLQDDWQLTLEASYLSDENFLESFYRREFNTDKEQETIAHLKKIRDNWGLSILAKTRINDFVNQTEEQPTVEFHWTGQSLFDDQMTFFSDSRVSMLRDRYAAGSASDLSATMSQQGYTFATSRAELDWPLLLGNSKVVPYSALSYGYEDQNGFMTKLGGTSATGEQDIFVGEFGVRASTQFWKVDPTAINSFWDITGIRHIVKPHVEAAFFSESDDVAEQRDIVNVGLSQIWQTKRGPYDDMEVVDWMRLDVDATFVNDDLSTLTGPDDFIWNNPSQPLIFRRNSDSYGIRRDKINADYFWQVTDTTAVLSDMNYDIDEGDISQLNIGISHFRYPDLSYYLGSRYLKDVTVLGEKGSHALRYALAYQLNPKYTVVLSQEYNFDYGKSVDSELTLIRRYHRVFWAFTINTDDSLDRTGIMFSIWPQGVRELALGSRKYFGLSGSGSDY